MGDKATRWMTPLHGLLALALVAFGCASQTAEAPRPEPAGSVAPEAPAAEHGEAEHGDEGGAAATADDEMPTESVAEGDQDVEWLTDEQGRRYHLVEVPRVERTYRWENEEHTLVRLRFGLVYHVDHYDDDTFYIRVYESPKGEQTAPQATVPPPPSPGEIAASYRVEVPEADLLRFTDFGRGLPRSGQWRHGFDVADMNGDGHPDLVFGPPRRIGRQPVIYLGDGQGTWQRWGAVFDPLTYDYGAATAGDLDGDGVADFVLGMHFRGVVALLGDGTGRFRLWSKGLPYEAADQEAQGAAFSSRSVALTDWNGDGRLDIVALGEGPKSTGRNLESEHPVSSMGARVFLNHGDGSWEASQAPGRDQSFGSDLTLGDFDGDGRRDFATASSRQGWRKVLYLDRDDGAFEQRHVGAIRPGGFSWAVAAADFDGDGRDDLAVSYITFHGGVWRSGVDVILDPAGEAARRVPVIVEEDKDGFWSLAAGDLDGDRAADLVTVSGSAQLVVLLGDGRGGFTRAAAAPLAAKVPGCRGYGSRLADLDGDGRDEIVVALAGERSGIPGVRETLGCPGGGSVKAFKAERR